MFRLQLESNYYCNFDSKKNLGHSNLMKVAFITDVHANLPALNCALAKIDEIHCDEIIIGGDSIGIGPHPAECLDILMDENKFSFINGNHELMVLYELSEENKKLISPGELEHTDWYKSQLTPEMFKFLNQKPLFLKRQYEGVDALFLHYPYDPGQPLEDIPYLGVKHDDDYIKEIFSKYSANLICFGHDHLPSYNSNEKKLINPGALGCSKTSIARFVVIAIEGNEFEIEKFALDYDDSTILNDFETRQVPERDYICRTFYGNRLR